MAKKRLTKKQKFITASGKGHKVSKVLKLSDKQGNDHLITATIISIKKNQSAALDEDRLESMDINRKIIAPPLNMGDLAVLSEFSTELGQTIQSMEIGIEGFGSRLIERDMTDEQKKENEKAIKEEKAFLTNFMLYPNADDSFVSLRRKTRNELEHTGNTYWELVENPTNRTRYSCFNHIKASNIWITRQDKIFTKKTVNCIDENLKVQKKIFLKKFRRFVQIINNKKVYFKEFGDPRVIDRRTGEVGKKSLKTQHRANELYHFKIPSNRPGPYGMPRFTGNIITIKGSRQSDETNILTLMNNQVPSMAIMVNGGMLTEGSITRLQEFVDTQLKGDANYSKFLIIEGESAHDSLSGPSSVKIEIKPLTREQHTDSLWQEYDSNNASKIRRSFRTAPILTGLSDDYTRAAAQESERLTEKYVYNPEREEEDVIINKFFLRQRFKFWIFKSNSPNVTNDQDIVKILTGAEKSGALTPRISRLLLEDVLNRELPEFGDDLPKEFNPDVPFSFTLAKLMHEAGMANQNGTMAPQGQIPKAPRGRNNNMFSNSNRSSTQEPGEEDETKFDPVDLIHSLLDRPMDAIKALTDIRDGLEKELDEESFGEDRSDYDFSEGDSERRKKKKKKKKKKVKNEK